MIAEIRYENNAKIIRKLPSEIFALYYFNNEDYSHQTPPQLPSCNNICWFSILENSQKTYYYLTLKNLFHQKIHIPEKYNYVYRNRLQNKIMISDEKQVVEKGWKKLKLQKEPLIQLFKTE